jgi:hydrogenase-4 component F
MANHLVLLWALIEVSTLCAAPLVARGEAANPRAVAWRYMLYSSMTLAITFLGFMCADAVGPCARGGDQLHGRPAGCR